MWKCLTEGCKKEFKNIVGLTTHLRHNYGKTGHPKSIQEYYDKYLKKDNEGRCQNPTCPYGHPLTTFQSIIEGYSIGCCPSCSQKTPKARKKFEQTCFKKYGVKHHLQNGLILDKQKKTNIKKYGYKNVMQIKDIKNRSIKTRMEKSDEINEARKQTVQKKWNQNNVMQVPEIARKLSNIFIDKSKNSVIRRLKLIGFEIIEYTKCSSKCVLKCSHCGNIIELEPKEILHNNRIYACKNCYPKKYGKMQNEISNFFNDYIDNIVINDKTTLDGKEIDIFFPEYNIGIEFNGLYWHGERNGCNKYYHLEKSRISEKKNVQLIHIFEDEWIEKKDIIKSILKHKLGKSDHQIPARKTKIVEVDYLEASSFMNENHLQKKIAGKYNIALAYGDKLVSMLIVGNPRFNKNYEYEILRFCNLRNTSVMGGFSKLFSYFVQTYNTKSVVSYADARFGYGKVYLHSGFKLLGLSQPNYFYLTSYGRESRMKYQKHKLKDKLELYDPNLTEWENMQMNGYDRIWDCGNYVYVWIKNNRE